MVRDWRTRLVAIAGASGFLAVALGIRVIVGKGNMLDGSGALAQHSGTALYASMIYAGAFVLAPRARPPAAGTAAIIFCWLVEFLQLTGLPAKLSEQSLIARLVLGVQFDAIDLAWYVIGVLPLVVLHVVFIQIKCCRNAVTRVVTGTALTVGSPIENAIDGLQSRGW